MLFYTEVPSIELADLSDSEFSFMDQTLYAPWHAAVRLFLSF